MRDKLSGTAFGEAGATVVIEEGLAARSARCTCSATGPTVLALASAQDYKRVGDGDEGANTGGMGAYAPMASSMGDERVDDDHARIIAPTLAELRRARHRLTAACSTRA